MVAATESLVGEWERGEPGRRLDILPEMMRPFRFFAGGPIGSGRQYMPWVHRLDWIEMVRWIVDTPAVA